MPDETYHPEYGELPIPAYDWPSAYIAVINQAPVTSYTTALLPRNQLHLTPSARRPRAARVGPGDQAPEFDLLCTDGRRVTMADFAGMPLVLRFTRAVSETFV